MPITIENNLPSSSEMVGDSGSGGSSGLVPAPVVGDADKYLKGDGSWSFLVPASEAEATTARTIVSADESKMIELSNVATTTVTLPLNATTALDVGFQFEVWNHTATATHVVAPEGAVDINGANSSFTLAAWGKYTVKKIATDAWVIG